MAAFCVHIIKNAAKTTSKGKHNEREMAKDRDGNSEKSWIDIFCTRRWVHRKFVLETQLSKAESQGISVHLRRPPLTPIWSPSSQTLPTFPLDGKIESPKKGNKHNRKLKTDQSPKRSPLFLHFSGSRDETLGRRAVEKFATPGRSF